ncbi:MAG: T9SS type A sorting domain-containing protein [Bacteroidetes bacterium]|nr:T9SS type A sorting domain-containing protein [Bacteroidota bacterium]
MKQVITALFILLFAVNLSNAQSVVRSDALWGKVALGTITLDGNMNEADWAKADSVQVIYGQPGALPTSGWTSEFNENAITDPIRATVKFLVKDHYLYLGFKMPDSSVGGIADWARWDGILMNIRDKASPNRPLPATEFFYTWWYLNVPQYLQPGTPPRFIGRFGNFSDTTRTPEQRAAWDAGYRTIGGVSCDDTTPDQGWEVEMKIDVALLGYDITRSTGDIIQLNFSIWDCDWVYGSVPSRISTARAYYQYPWGNANGANAARIYAKPDVTVNTTNPPLAPVEYTFYNGSNKPAPVIDGNLDEEVWRGAQELVIGWDDTLTRAAYPGIGPYQSGQYQPELVAGSRPPVVDPGYVKIKYFHRDGFLYFGADFNDQLIQGTSMFDAVDGFATILIDRDSRASDNALESRMLRLSFDSTGALKPGDYMQTLLDSTQSAYAFQLKGASTINNNNDVDDGYVIEGKIQLTGLLGYPQDLGDRSLFFGTVLYDGDSFTDPALNYGTRTWFMREHAGGPALAWVYLSNDGVVGVEDEFTGIPSSLELYGNYPNPFNPSTRIKFSAPQSGQAEVLVYNSLGQLVSRQMINAIAGAQEINFDARGLTSGVYLYKVNFKNASNGGISSASGKMILMK